MMVSALVVAAALLQPPPDCERFRGALWFAGSGDPVRERSEALACHQAASDAALGSATAIRLAALASVGQRWDEARQWAQVGRSLARSSGEHGLEAAALDELGNAAFGLGDFDQARADFAAGHLVATRHHLPAMRAVLAKDLAITHATLGHPEQALALLEEAQGLRDWWPAPELEVAIEGNLGSIWNRLGVLDLADQAFGRALASARSRGEPREIIDALLRLATLRLESHSARSALPLLREAAELARTSDVSRNDREWLEGLLAEAQQEAGEFEEAVAGFRRRLEVAQTLPDRPLGPALIDLAVTLVQVYPGDRIALAEAEGLLDRAAAGDRGDSPRDHVRLLRGRAYVAAAAGDLDGAISTGLAALAAHETVRRNLPSPSDRRRWGQTGRDLRDLLAHQLLVRGHCDDMAQLYAVLEAARAQSLRDALAEADLPTVDDDPRVRELLQRLAALVDDESPSGAAARTALEAEIDALRAVRRARDRRRERPTLDAIAVLTLAEAQAAMPADTKILTLDEVGGRVLATVVSKHEFHARHLEVDTAELALRIDAANEVLDQTAAGPVLERISRDLLDPLESWLNPLPAYLVVVASDRLTEVPFDLLRLGATTLGSAAVIELAPSLAIWFTLAARETAGPRSQAGLAIGLSGDGLATHAAQSRGDGSWRALAATSVDLRPIPNAVREVQRIRRRLRGATDVWVDLEASEARFKRHPLAALDWLHFATHGLVNGSAPSRSALWLAPGEGEDGLLQAREIAALPLRARLIVLSACRTTQRDHLTRENEGLARAFLAAGASGVIAARQDVDDIATAELMAELYRHLAAGTPPSRALQQAKLTMARRHRAPRSWSSFGFLGAGRQQLIQPTASSVGHLGWLSAVGVALAALVVLRKLGERRRRGQTTG